MPPDSSYYKVEVIYSMNPHILWVEVSENLNNDDFKFEQVGVYGVLPLESKINIEKEEVKVNKCDQWTVAANTIMKKTIDEASEVWFSVTFLDKRTSIFDDNIHKYGEFLIKLKNGQYKMLSEHLIEANIAYSDDTEFHKRLSLGYLKTKLSPNKTQEVVKQIVKYYIHSNKKHSNWKGTLKNQTSAHNMAEGLEKELSALTTSNLEKHNNKMLNKIFEDKIRDFELCKDIEEESLGRGYVKSSKKHKDPIQANVDLAEQKLSINNQSYHDIKSFLAANAITKDAKQQTTEAPINNKVSKSSLLSRKMNIISELERNRLNKQGSELQSDDSKSELSQFSVDNKIGGKNERNKNEFEVFSEQEAHLSDNSIEVNVKTSSIKEGKYERKQRTSSLNPVVYGPPEVNPQYLIVQDAKDIVQDAKDIDEDNNQVTHIEKPPVQTLEDTKLSVAIKQEKFFNDFYEKVVTIPKYVTKVDFDEPVNKNKDLVVQPVSNVRKDARSLLLTKKLKAYDNLSVNSKTSSSSKDGSSISEKDFEDSLIVKKIEENYKAVPTLRNRIITDESKSVDKLKNNVNPFKNIDPSISVFVDKLVSPVLMVHTKHNKRIQPVYEMRDIFFNNHIHLVLRNMSIKHPMILQSVSWNTILRGYSLFMISPPQSGKTFGYLPAVCRLVTDVSGAHAAGPICIIVCATAKSVSFVEEYAKMFLGLEDRVLACYPGVDDLYITSKLLNGCDLLVSTPSYLIRLMQLNEYGVDLRRLSIFVFDDCEHLSTTYLDEVKFFLYKIKDTLKSRANNELKVQYILASRVWCDFMERVAKKAPDTVISIGAFQECILYSKSKTSVSFVKKEDKLDVVFEFLKEIDGSKKMVIVCKTDNEVELLEKALKRSDHTVFSCNNEMTVHELFKISLGWADYKAPIGPILICCDGNLTHMNITDAHYLIHFSLPDLFSMFCKRFCVLNDNYSSIFQTDDRNVKIKIILDGSNIEQLPKMMNYIKRCTNHISSSLDEMCNEISKEKEIVKAKNLIPLCDKLLIFGHCPDFFNCKERHEIFEEHDTPKAWVPKDGIILFKINHFHSALLYSARLLSHIVKGATTKYPQNYTSLSIKMGMYYSKEFNRRLHGVPKIGDICAVSLRLNFYARCQVVKILSQNDNGIPYNVLVNLLDEEKYEVTKDIYLYHLPDELKVIETRAVLVRLVNVKPKDKDITFSDLACEQLKKITDNEDLFIKGRVTLTLGNCVFVDTLEACQELTSLNETVIKHNLVKELLNKHAQLNPDNLSTIKQLCTKSGFILKKEVKVKEIQNPVKNLPKGTWAYLEDDVLCTVYLTAKISPEKFFVRHSKFVSCMNSLMEEIKKYTNNYTFSDEWNVKEGDLVLAECPEDGIYERARVDNIIGEKVKCFFVDQGDCVEIPLKKLIPITEQFINQLPFQAIECRLVGIRPPGEDWSDFSKNWFSDNCTQNINGDLKLLYIKYFTKEIAEFTNYKYGVALIDTNFDADEVINQQMIDLNLAAVNLKEKEYLDKVLEDMEESNKQRKEEVDSEDEWEKISQVTQTPSVIENIGVVMTPNSQPRSELLRSMPLVDSDDDNFDKWEVNMDSEGFSPLLPAFKTITTENGIKDTDDTESKQIVSYSKAPVKPEEVNQRKIITEELDSDDLTSSETLSALNTSTESDQKRRPRLLWYQNKKMVTIKIQLIAVKDYVLEINDRTLKFSANVNDTDYEFDIELYGVVDKNKSSHYKTGLYIIVKLHKVLHSNWLSLVKLYATKNFISYDVDRIDTSSEDEEVDQDSIKNIVNTIHEIETDSEDDETMDDVNFTYRK